MEDVPSKNDIRTMAYNTLVRPQVEYASAVWSPHTKENNKKKSILFREGQLDGCQMTTLRKVV